MPATQTDRPPAGAVRTREERLLLLRPMLQQRILVLDGATGTLVQRYGLSEADFRGERFRDHPRDVRGDSDLLTLTRPDVVRAVHDAYLAAGADIISTDTFTATRIAQADYGLESVAYEMHVEAARIARAAADAAEAREPGTAALRRRFAGTHQQDRLDLTRTSPTRPPARSPSSSWPRPTPRPPAGCCSAAPTCSWSRRSSTCSTPRPPSSPSRASSRSWAFGVPLWISGTITDASGRTLSGHTVEAFWNAIRHAEPLIVGLNCALGARQLRAHVEELSGLADTFVAVHPNAGLPNEFGGYDESPESMAAVAARVRRRRAWST